ncbi:translation initiation factor eIF-2B epsilon subunit, GEF [Marasmius crinis-equi]|uniref:Translation initiation factor eIF2B subunit epsilon n=1 Tax=Marasmius crinis-equi TaxID=585013 RepID=A0ABR3F3X6_9AGAR
MAPKSAGKEKLIGDEDEVLQAVILADSFNKRFRPLTTRKPRCLLPICNAPLLDWTFESLALAGVQEIFVICRSHAEQVKQTIAESRWSKPGSGIKIVPIMTAKETFSPGDALRDVYTRGLVTGDFVLVHGDLVSNIRVDEVVRVHKERKKVDRDAIMTIVVKESGSGGRTRSKGDSSVFVLDSDTSECLHYESVIGYPPKIHTRIPREILVEHPDVDIRNDLIDCGIDICSVEDNFDYLDIRRDFVHGVLTSDLLMKNIYCYVAKDGYAARVQDTKSYDSISKDILSRWTFPLVPDNNHPSGNLYEHRRGNKYIARDGSVVLARTSKIGNNSLVGSSTQVYENAQIISSVIGRNCIIGPNTVIDNAYIFDNARIGSGCVIERSIIGAGVTVGDGTKIPRGCLIADGVDLGPGLQLEPFERLSLKREADEDEDEDEDSDEDIEEDQAAAQTRLGLDPSVIVWSRTSGEDEDDEDEEGSVENAKNQRFLRIGDDATDLEHSDPGSESSDGEDESSDDDSDLHLTNLATSSTTSLDTATIAVQSSNLMAEKEFRHEVNQSLERAFTEGHSVDNAAVELKTLRMASNVPIGRVREAVLAAIVEKIQIVEGGGAPQRQEIAAVVRRWGPLIGRIGGFDAVETISELQSHCTTSNRLPLFGQILAALYQDDIVEEDDIRAWHQLPSSQGDGNEQMKKCWLIGGHMVQQFDEQESDEDDDEEDDSE